MITVVKRNGSRVPLDIGKIQRQVANCCRGIDGVSPSMIEIKAQIELHDGIHTKTIDELLLQAMVGLIDETENPEINNVNYQYVAGRQKVSMLRKEVFGEYDPPKLYSIVKKNVEVGMYSPELLEWYSEEEWNIIDLFIDHHKDEHYTYAAIAQLCEKYLVQNRASGQIFETPQVRYAVAAATAFHAEQKDKRLKYVKEYYECASEGHFTLATPVLAGLGTTTKQFSSCVLISSDDTLDSIFAAGEMMAKYASKRAGIGLEIGRIRPLGAPIRNGEIKHTGMVPFLKKWYGDLRSCSQGGIRNASCTVTFPIWHAQFEDLIVLKNNQGTEETRVRQMDYSVVISAMFWRRYKNNENITLFDPHEVPDLYQAYYRDSKEFETLYLQYEQDKEKKKKVLSADEIFKNGILKERTDTGRIYLVNIDNVINQGPFDTTLDPIYQSNLCQEILLPTKPFQRIEDAAGRIALCTLGSINWGAFRNPQDMRKACRVLVRSLSNLLSYQDFLSVQSELANKDFEPLGVGITNLAFWHARRNLKYGDADSLKEVKRWMEHQAFYLTEASVELAQERGACERSQYTYYGRGVFPWERRNKGVDELTDFTPSLDWEPLRQKMKTYGIRNATLMAVAPVESSSVVLNSTNGIEMPMELISVKESKAGSFVQVVPEYKRLKIKYQLMWDQLDCEGYLKTSAVLAAYIDQSLSTNTFYNPAHFPNGKVPGTLIAKNLMLAYKWGLKTIYYSLINKVGAKISVTTTNVVNAADNVVIYEEQEENCESCVL
ncbi:MAG: ribonucleoside-diphosphate reductase subunit alpha [Proteobacteria bacterium]|nr:ribonucleoside-diphosphate reductase subunit alpha [Pseudomonadota bacterium]NBP14124.1 ribonucleoside-diphosphate reductase subunit alpha [bacterium]